MNENIEKRKIYLEEEKPIIEFPVLVTAALIFMAFCMGLSLIFLPWQIVLILFLGLCLSIAVFLDLYIGVLIFLIGAFFHPGYWFPALSELHPARNLAFAVLFIWGFHTIVFHDFKIVKSKQNFIIIGFLTFCLISTFNKYFDFNFSFFIEFGTKALVLYFAIANLIKSRNQVIFFAWFLMTIGLVLALIGIYQYIHHIGVVYREEGLIRISGMAEDANVFALDLTMTLPITLGLFFASSKTTRKIFIFLVAALLTITTVLTYSRAGFLQLLIVLFFCLGIRFFRKRGFISVIVVLLVIMMFSFFLPEKYIQRMQTVTKFSDPAVGHRVTGWIVGTQMFLEHPLKGVGLGRFRFEYIERAAHSPELTWKGYLDAHNIYIHTAAEIGIFGLIFLLILIYLTFKDINESKRIFMAKNDKLMWEISNSIQIALISFLIGGMFISYLHLLIFWIIIPLVITIKQVSLKNEKITGQMIRALEK